MSILKIIDYGYLQDKEEPLQGDGCYGATTHLFDKKYTIFYKPNDV